MDTERDERAALNTLELARQVLAETEYGVDGIVDLGIEALMMWRDVPAVCPHRCEVEIDGRCPHGGKSVLVFFGYM